jgi:hypothetical protein
MACNGDEVPLSFELMILLVTNVILFPTAGGFVQAPLSAALTKLGSSSSAHLLSLVSF